MEEGIWVILTNSLDSEIFREFVAGNDVYGADIRHIIAVNHLTFSAGDTIKFEAGSSERVN